MTVLMVAGFFFVGVESAAVAAGEARDPQRTVPWVINSVFLRIMLFYVGAIAVVATLIPYTDPSLLDGSESNLASSPFTLVFQRARLAAAAALMNAVVLTSVLSAGNSTVYVGSRLLYSMAHGGRAPRVFGRTSSHGVPVRGVLVTTGISCLALASSLVGDSVVYTWLYDATGLSGFIVWTSVCLAPCASGRPGGHRGAPATGCPTGCRSTRGAPRVPGRAVAGGARVPLYPWGTWFALLVFLGVIVGQGLGLMLSGDVSWYGLLAAYVSLTIALGLWVGAKVVRGSRLVAVSQVNLSASDVQERAVGAAAPYPAARPTRPPAPPRQQELTGDTDSCCPVRLLLPGRFPLPHYRLRPPHRSLGAAEPRTRTRFRTHYVRATCAADHLLYGEAVSDEQIQAWTDEAEAGHDLSGLPRPRRGRQPVGEGAGTVVPVRLDTATLVALTARAEAEGMATRSEAIRAAVRERAHATWSSRPTLPPAGTTIATGSVTPPSATLPPTPPGGRGRPAPLARDRLRPGQPPAGARRPGLRWRLRAGHPRYEGPPSVP